MKEKKPQLYGWDDGKIYFRSSSTGKEHCVSDDKALSRQLENACEIHYKSAAGKPVNYAFIDSQNLNLGIKEIGWDLDFKRFRVYLKDKYKICKSFLFIGYLPGNESLYTYLQESGFILIFKPAMEIKKGHKKVIKGNVDAELVMHAMIELANYNKAIIVSGDGDFHCLIEYLEKHEKLAKIVIPNRNKYSALLRKFREYFVFLDKLEQKLGKKKRGSNLRTEP